MPTLADLASGYASQQTQPMSLAELANAYSSAPTPTSEAQGKFGRIADLVLGGLRNWVETPGRAMREGITTGQAADWAAPTALSMVGSPIAPSGALGSSAKVIDMGNWQLSRELAAIRQHNLRDTFAESGGGIIQEMPNKWSIGYLPGATPPYYHSHVLVSPQGSAALYGQSPRDLIKRGFPDDEIPGLLNSLRKGD
jgi:hypothetical protein